MSGSAIAILVIVLLVIVVAAGITGVNLMRPGNGKLTFTSRDAARRLPEEPAPARAEFQIISVRGRPSAAPPRAGHLDAGSRFHVVDKTLHADSICFLTGQRLRECACDQHRRIT